MPASQVKGGRDSLSWRNWADPTSTQQMNWISLQVGESDALCLMVGCDRERTVPTESILMQGIVLNVIKHLSLCMHVQETWGMEESVKWCKEDAINQIQNVRDSVGQEMWFHQQINGRKINEDRKNHYRLRDLQGLSTNNVYCLDADLNRTV